jgi:hypothetical protein
VLRSPRPEIMLPEAKLPESMLFAVIRP